MSHGVSLSIAFALTLVSAPLRAQSQPSAGTPADRGFLTINGGYQQPSSFSDTARPTQFVEPGTIETAYRPKAGPELDGGGGVRVWRRLAVAVNVAFYSRAAGGTVNAQVPHPLLFGRPRAVQGEAPALTRREIATHIQAVWMAPLGGPDSRWRLDLAGGPSIFNIRQAVVENVTLLEVYPFDVGTLGTVVSRSIAKSGAGFNVGADLSYMLTAKVGVGTGVTFSRARISLPEADGHELRVDAGGAHVGAGIRIRF